MTTSSGSKIAAVVSPGDESCLRRALELAERGRGWVEPNPLVGAVVVRDGQVVGEGWHERFGGPHAEVIALDRAGALAQGATLYVSLEPCCHHGKTPPCTERIIEAGIRRVVAAMGDPFADVAGKGFEAMRQAGIEVLCCGDLSLLYQEARRLNAPYLKLLSTGLPYVHAKWAMTLDGKIATATGDSRWISGEQARRWVHALRGKMDAIIVGAGTVRADDPLLTARVAAGEPDQGSTVGTAYAPPARVAVRIVLDSQARLGSHTQLVRTASEVPVVVATTAAAHASDRRRLREAGCECLVLAESRAEGGEPGKVESRESRVESREKVESRESRVESPGRTPILALLQELGRRRMTNVLVEGGAAVLGSFFDAGVIDAAHVFVAPKLLGGAASKTPIAGQGVPRLPLAPSLEIREITRMGSDLYIRAERRV